MDAFARRVLDALPLTVCTIDLEGCITSTNRSWSQFARASGAPPVAAKAAVGTSLSSALGDSGVREHVERGMALLRTGRSQTVTWEFPAGGPDEQVLLMQLSPLHDGHSVTGYVFSAVDITQSHRARGAVLEAAAALARPIALDRALQEVGQQIHRVLLSDAMVIAVIEEASDTPHTAHHAGYAGTVSGIEHRLAPAWRESIAAATVVAHRGEGGVEITAPMISEDRTLGVITVRVSDTDPHQRLDDVRRDLAAIAAQAAAAVERSLLVRRGEQKHRLEAIAEVAAGVAHELRNPLFGISSAAQLLRFRAREDPVVEKNVGRILREGERLNRIATELLEFGRPSPLNLRPADPDAVWDEVLESQRGRLESRSLQLRRTRADPPARCLVDHQQLAQVFVNLLLNAAEAAPEASDLTLGAGTIRGGAYRCRLHNGGPPIPPDALGRAFEIFFSTKPDGTGIGLALSHRIIEDHHGTIELESSTDAGTTVTVVLPAAG
jgi:signal transduction histidine kinase